MNREDFQKLAKSRKKEAQLLLDGVCYNGAYYLAGYAVECALKAVIAKMTKEHDFPDKKRVNDSWVHDLTKLLKSAKLEDKLEDKFQGDPAFQIKWKVIVGWSEASRYEIHDEQKAKSFLEAAFGGGGVLEWLETHW